MKSHIIQKPVAVILGNSGNIGCLAARAFACQGTAVAMMHEAGERSSRVVDCLPGDNHFAMSGCLSRSSDLASFAGLVHTLYAGDCIVPHAPACPFCWSMLSFPAP